VVEEACGAGVGEAAEHGLLRGWFVGTSLGWVAGTALQRSPSEPFMADSKPEGVARQFSAYQACPGFPGMIGMCLCAPRGHEPRATITRNHDVGRYGAGRTGCGPPGPPVSAPPQCGTDHHIPDFLKNLIVIMFCNPESHLQHECLTTCNFAPHSRVRRSLRAWSQACRSLDP
jgi:hypothetical protein